MTKNEIVAGLLDNAADRRTLVSADDPDSIFRSDAEIMEGAAELINKLWEENLRLRARLLPWRLFRPYRGKRVKQKFCQEVNC